VIRCALFGTEGRGRTKQGDRFLAFCGPREGLMGGGEGGGFECVGGKWCGDKKKKIKRCHQENEIRGGRLDLGKRKKKGGR